MSIRAIIDKLKKPGVLFLDVLTLGILLVAVFVEVIIFWGGEIIVMSIRKIIDKLKKPSATSLGVLLFSGFVVGVIFWGGFNTAMEATNTETFCISCHEMEENVYQEYQDTIHYSNRSGVRATCPDCHVPKPWFHKIKRKIQASNELYHKVLGTIDTPEKFEAKRLKLAKHVWKGMEETDSRECRNCHDYESMDYTKQQRRAVPQHVKGFDEGKTCIDCHKGIAHSLPAFYEMDPSAVTGTAGH